MACIAKKSIDSRGKTKGESWQEIGSGRKAVKRRQLGRQLETTKKRECCILKWGGGDAEEVRGFCGEGLKDECSQAD